MASLKLVNLISSLISFEATVLSAGGTHQTVRAALPPGGTVTVPLPAGVTPAMIAESAQVKTEMARPSPRYTIAAAPDGSIVDSLADGEVFRVHFPGIPAAATTAHVLGTTTRAGKLSRVRLISKTALVGADQVTVDSISVSGVSLGIPAAMVKTPLLTGAFTTVDFDLGALVGDLACAVESGAYLEMGITIAGGVALSEVVVEVLATKN